MAILPNLMMAKMSKRSHRKLFSAQPGQGLSFKPNMKQIDEAVQAPVCAIGFWQPSWILLKKLKNAKKHTANIWKKIRVGVFE